MTKNPLNIKKIKELLQKKQLNYKDLIKAGLTKNTLGLLLNPECDSYKIISIFKLCEILGVYPNEIISH